MTDTYNTAKWHQYGNTVLNGEIVLKDNGEFITDKKKLCRYSLKDKDTTILVKDETKTHTDNPICQYIMRGLMSLTIEVPQSVLDDKEKPLTQKQLNLIQMINEKRIPFPTVDDYGRIHTAVAQLRKDLRKYLLIDGQPVNEIDTPNSHPLWFIIHVKSNLVIDFNNPDKETVWSALEERQAFSALSIHGEQSPHPIYQEIEDWLTHCNNRTIYYHLAELAGLPTDKDFIKKEFKPLFMSVFYGEINDNVKRKDKRALLKVLKEHYPNLCAVIAYEKRRAQDVKLMNTLIKIKNKGTNKTISYYGDKSYALFSHKIQRLESSFMFNSFMPRLRDDLRLPFSIPVHDSIIYPNGLGDAVKRLMAEEFNKLGANPELSEEIIYEVV